MRPSDRLSSLSGGIVKRYRCAPDQSRLASQRFDRYPELRRVIAVDISNRVRRLGAVATVTVLSVLAVAPAPGWHRTPAPAASSAPASCAPRARHQARLDRRQGHDRRGDRGGHRRRRRPDRRQLDLHGQRRAGQPVPDVRQGHLRRRHQAELRRQPGAERLHDRARGRQAVRHRGALRRHGGRGELLGRRGRDRAWSQDFLPSGLVPNQDLLLPGFQHVPNALAFQAASFIALIYNKDTQPWITSFKDLADPRLKGKVTLRRPATSERAGSCWPWPPSWARTTRTRTR